MNNYISTPNEELYHYGVKGMKWGVRRRQTDFSRMPAQNKSAFANARLHGGNAGKRLSKVNRKYQKKHGVEIDELKKLHADEMSKWSKLNTYVEKHSRKSDWDHDGNFDDISVGRRLYKNDKTYRKLLDSAATSSKTLQNATLGKEWLDSYLRDSDKAYRKDSKRMFR